MPVDEGKSEGTNEDRAAHNEERQSKPEPVVLHQPDAAGIAQSASTQAQQAPQQRKKWMPSLNVGFGTQLILAVFQAGLFGVTIWQAIIAQGAAADGHLAAMAAQASAQTATESLQLTQRAVANVVLSPSFSLSGLRVPATLENLGNTQAIDITLQIEEEFTPLEVIDAQAFAHLSNTPKVSEDELDQHSSTGFNGVLTQQIANLISSQADDRKMFMFVYGSVAYKDVFKVAHEKYYCEEYEGDKTLLFKGAKECSHPHSF